MAKSRRLAAKKTPILAKGEEMPELAKVALGFAGRFRFCVAKSRRLAAKKTPILAKGEEIGLFHVAFCDVTSRPTKQKSLIISQAAGC